MKFPRKGFSLFPITFHSHRISSGCFEIGSAILPFSFLVFCLVCQPKPEEKPIGSTYLELSKPEVWQVPPNSQAQIIGLTVGDILLSYNDEVIESYSDFLKIEKNFIAQGVKGKLAILRNGQELTLETEPVPLNFIPKSKYFSASLAKALEDILQHFAVPAYYEWLAAITGESFGLTLNADDCFSWGTGGRSLEFLPNIAKLTGLSFETLYQQSPTNSFKKQTPINAVKSALTQSKGGTSAIIIYAKWNGKSLQWGIPTHLQAIGDSSPRVYGYTIGSDQEQPVSGEIVAAYRVKFRGGSGPEPASLLRTVLTQALEIGLSTRDSGWHSGLEAYDILVKHLEHFPICPKGPDTANECFDKLIWSLIASKESANRFFADMKEALPEQAALFDEVIGRNRAVIARLEGITDSRLKLNSLTNQEKIATVLTFIAAIENDLLGFYEEIITEL